MTNFRKFRYVRNQLKLRMLEIDFDIFPPIFLTLFVGLLA